MAFWTIAPVAFQSPLAGQATYIPKGAHRLKPVTEKVGPNPPSTRHRKSHVTTLCRSSRRSRKGKVKRAPRAIRAAHPVSAFRGRTFDRHVAVLWMGIRPFVVHITSHAT
ncbi:hypothetical protein AMTR_s00119p00099020 [Amborella trichopoda]|uniref:Uncharacterized protein n=1 Tax=Amborella trichopoda TaxID=13333 RepID=W1NQ60_AMBTC|nr:hypothetical protein AMTR_s00119p00099020 [Amborella trichopoda]